MVTLLLSVGLLGGPLPLQAPVRYKIVTRSSTDIDLTSAGQGPQTITLISTIFVSVILSDTAGGRLATIVVDSNSFDAGAMAAQLPPEMSADPKGASFHLYVVNGKSISAITPTPMSIQAAQAGGGIELVLSGLRTFKAGDSWTDTTKTDTTVATSSAKGSRIAIWTARDADLGSALQLDATWTGTTSAGVGPAQIEMQVTGASHVTAVAGQLARQANSTGSGSATMNAGGMSFPMKVTTEVTASQIP